MNRYLIIIEETPTGYSAYSPDVPGCVATGQTGPEVENQMHDAIGFHRRIARRGVANSEAFVHRAMRRDRSRLTIGRLRIGKRTFDF